MAKRFIDTNFYKSPFIRGLKGSLKGLYSFIICDCDGAGIWTFDLEIAGLYTGFNYSLKEFKDAFVDNGKAIDLGNGKYFFPDFIEHQYPKGLSEHNPAQKNFINELRKYSLIDEDLKVLKRPFEGSKVMVMEKVVVMEKEKVVVKKEESELIFPFQEVEFLDVWNVLVKSKKWRNKENSALQASLKKLSKFSLEDAIQMIENCIAGEWMGLVELEKNKNKNYGTGKQTNSDRNKSDLIDLVEMARANFKNFEMPNS